ncbi:MAG: PqqD family protein [Deltaproteobacteria bacterium]|nr:PqqD family protein [Deltaproteobacteria bacterium]
MPHREPHDVAAQADPPAGVAGPWLRLHPRAAWRSVGGEIFVITADRAFHRVAVPTAVDLIEQLAAAPARVDALADRLVRDYEVDRATALRDVVTFAECLVAKHIAVPVDSPADTSR